MLYPPAGDDNDEKWIGGQGRGTANRRRCKASIPGMLEGGGLRNGIAGAEIYEWPVNCETSNRLALDSWILLVLFYPYYPGSLFLVCSLESIPVTSVRLCVPSDALSRGFDSRQIGSCSKSISVL